MLRAAYYLLSQFRYPDLYQTFVKVWGYSLLFFHRISPLGYDIPHITQLNDTMRILTVFSSILLPLTFLTSIFGMQGFDLNNIHSIPQGFTILLVAMTVISAILFYMFWKRQWIFVPGNILRQNNNNNNQLQRDDEKQQ